MLPVHDLLQRTAADHPDKEAVVCGADRIPYGALDQAVNGLAAFLASRGIGPGDRVGIFGSKSVEEVIAIFGILRAGAAFVHVNPQYRDAHLRHVVADCGIKTIVVDNTRARVLAHACGELDALDLVISLSDETKLKEGVFPEIETLSHILQSQSDSAFAQVEVRPDDLASIIYTSGSTGMPKGIMVTHRILYDATGTSAEVLENTANDRIISVTPFSFDGALSQLLTAVYVGGTLVQQRSNFPKDIVDTLLGERITGFHAVPSLWGVLLQERSPFSQHSYPDLRYVSIIGEVLPAKHLARLREILATTRFYLMYGTTEAFRSTYLPPDDLNRKPGSAGIPFPGVTLMTVDDDGRPCAPGQIGMLLHKGAFVSPGYWNDPERTARTFVDGWLHTGDQASIDDEGYLYYAGRRDGLIKVQGFRVSPEEVERCLFELDTVVEAAVIGAPAKEIGTVIKALMVLKPAATTTEKDVISHCRQQLPHYMVPSIVEFREALPKTNGHKVNRAALV
jgi:amino acid adenylation domain-containing protein